VWSHPSLPPSCDTVLIPRPEEDDSGRAALAVLRRFDFDNEIRMMSVLVLELPPGQIAGDQRKVALLSKGAPER
jgi:magnesium-transporting ATPase (P-type)